jgi:putative ABC transport system permease protein
MTNDTGTPSPAPAPTEGVEARKSNLWFENLRQALVVIRTHRLRSSLLILGVAIGVTTVLAMVTVMSGLGKRVEEDIVSANRPYLIISRYDPMQGGPDRRDLYRRKKLTVPDARAIQDSCRTVDRVDYQISAGRMRILRYGGERTNLIQVMGASSNFGFIYSFVIEEGRFFTPLEVERNRRVVVLGYGPAKDLFPNRDPIGKRLKIGNIEYEVVGTLETRQHFMGSIGDNFAVIPYTTFMKDHSESWDDYQIGAVIKPEYTLEEGTEEITALLRARRKVKPGAVNDFYITTSETFRELISGATRYIGLVLVVISSIGLMVGGIGVMNIMLISVTERTREVGVRMAVGAKRSDIIQQFLIEAATLTGIGGLIGIVMGLFVAKGVSNLIRFPYSVPVIWIFIAFVFSAGIGIIFGIYPAHRAARMDPIKALHFE